jgi:hypothetical protein
MFPERGDHWDRGSKRSELDTHRWLWLAYAARRAGDPWTWALNRATRPPRMQAAMHNPALLVFRLMSGDSRPSMCFRHNVGQTASCILVTQVLLLVAGLVSQYHCDAIAIEARLRKEPHPRRDTPQRGFMHPSPEAVSRVLNQVLLTRSLAPKAQILVTIMRSCSRVPSP